MITAKSIWQKLQSHQRAALAIAVIVALADTVIVYDLWQAGAWFTTPALSGAKTVAFILLFIGSLIAEMQDLQRRTRALLLVVVIILGAYQAMINIVVNYHGANVPQEVAGFFAPLLTSVQVTFWFSIADGVVRTLVVVLMWLVTGLVWRGVATGKVNVKEAQPVTQLTATSDDKAERIVSLLAYYRANPNGSQAEAARVIGVSRQTVSNYLQEMEDAGVVHRNGQGVQVITKSQA